MKFKHFVLQIQKAIGCDKIWPHFQSHENIEILKLERKLEDQKMY